MNRTEIQRKMQYFSIGADIYEHGWKKNYRDEYIKQCCESMHMTEQSLKQRNWAFYEDICLRADKLADENWEDEKILFKKWEDQKKSIIEKARMA